MTHPLLSAYVITALIIGTSCVGALMVLARLRNDTLAHLFLWFYLPCSVMVLAGLPITLVEPGATVSPTTWALFEYFEAFIGRYGVMLALPLFVHRLFDVNSRRRDTTLVVIVLVTLASQHVTELALGGSVWDARGDVMEDVISAGIVAYALWVAVTRRDQSVYRPLTQRFVALLALGTPLILFDIFVADGPGLRLTPLLYSVAGVLMVLALLGRYATPSGVAPSEWRLSNREEDVLRLVQQGLSTRDIAGELTISPNTVKTHLRAIFDKSGLRTRVALIAHTRPPPIG